MSYPAHRGLPATPAAVPPTPKASVTRSGRAHGPGLDRAEVGCTSSFTVEALDPYDERRRMGGDVVVARLMVGDDVTVEAVTLDNTDGTFRCTYVPKSIDRRQKLHVTVNGIPIRGSPFRPELVAGPTAARMSTASGPELYDSVAGKPTSLMVQARDCYGNPRRFGGDAFKLLVKANTPNRSEYADVFKTVSMVSEGTDHGDGTYTLTWSADIPGSYDLIVTLDREPIQGAPFRCYLASDFVRSPLSATADVVTPDEADARAPDGKRPLKPRDHAPPHPAERPSAAMVDGQLVCLSTAVSAPGASHRWPSAHTCQFKSQYDKELVYVAQRAPPCRWRSCLLPSHNTEAYHTLVGGPSSVYVITQSGGAGEAIDGISCAEVIGGGAWRPPQSFVGLRLAGRVPDAVSGFAAVYTPEVEGLRATAAFPGDDGGAPPSPTKDGEGDGGGGGGDGEEGAPAAPPRSLPPCLWLVGGTRPDGLYALLDCYNVEEERWMGDPLEFEAGAAITPPPMTASAATTSADGHTLWVFGGRTAEGLSNELWRFDVKNVAWALVAADGDPPEPREGHSLTPILSRFLCVFGGINLDLQPMPDIGLYDMRANAWSCVDLSPAVPRFGHVAGYSSGSLYIFGGSDGSKGSADVLRLEAHSLFPQISAIAFDTDPAKVLSVKASPSLNALAEKFSVECWVRPSSFPLNAPAVVKASNSYGVGFGFVCLDEASAKKYISLPAEKQREGHPKERNPWENALAEMERMPNMAFFVAGFKKETTALLRVYPNEWSHVAATFDGTEIVTYVNGKRADRMAPDPPLEPADITHTTGDLFIGGLPGKYGFDGLVDGIRLWSTTLAWEEIRQRMNDTLLGSEHPTLIGQWSCNEGAGELCVDSSGKHNDGTLEGDVPRVLCDRDHVAPTKTLSEVYVEENFERLRKWRIEFEKRVGREVTQADVLLAPEDIRKTARRLGLI